MHFLTLPALAFSLLPIFTNAHFQLKSPASRGDEDENQATYPCGGYDTISSERTQFPLAGGPIQLEMGHDHSEVQVNIAMGNDAVSGDAFTMTIMPILSEMGLGEFCLGNVMIPSSLNVQNGQNATLQVITDGHTGGLYNCADITFSDSAQPGPCTNGTNIKSMAYTGTETNVNGTDSGNASTTSMPTMSSSAVAAAASPTSGASKSLFQVGVIGVAVGAAAILAF